MKRTESMIYRPTDESRELVLYTVNDGAIYHSRIIPAIANLHKKYLKGIYNADLAADLFYYIATAASDSYNKEFGYKFSVTDRFTAAVDLAAYYADDIKEGGVML